jgi:fatty-acyl-CoA synthase
MGDAHTIGRLLRHRARTTPTRVAIDSDGRELTYGELDERSEALAAQFLERGLARGDRVATLTANSPEHVIVFFACAKAGLTLLPLNWRLAAAELTYMLEDAEPKLFLVAPEHEAAAAATDREYEHLADASGARHQTWPVETAVSDDDPLLLVYTSGTTGRPKGALLTQANCFWTNLSFDLVAGVGGEDVVLQVLPQYHVGGWNVQALLAWWKGARVILERVFDAGRCLRLIEEKRVTTMMGVPAIYLFIAQDPAFEDADLSSLHSAVVGGAPMPETLLETWHRRGVAVIQGYGLTEAAPNVLCLPPEDAVRKRGYAGKPYPLVEVRLSDEGELQVQGPNVFASYWRNEEATRAAFTDDGWLRTGDIAERDDKGFYRIRGRLKDMYISGGENVYPAEVENVLTEHAAIMDAAVVGVPDEQWGEAGVAFVVAGADVSEDELIAHCRARLAKFKVPRAVRFVDELPRSAMNKVLKDELRASLAERVTT